tara:strand:- start:194 stop:535 length:342 start_codon:yes stop_codon:yes gene_type:complete
MLFLVTKTAVISLVLIILVHSLYIFLKTNLTIPKIKDLVNKPDMRYKEIYNTLLKKNEKEESLEMKNELKKYLQSLSKEKTKPKKPPAVFPLASTLGGGTLNGGGSLNTSSLF